MEYPSSSTLYRWYERKLAEKANYHGSLDKEYIIKQKYINKPNHPRNPDISLKLDAIKRCISLGEGVEYVSRDIGYSRASIYSWYRKYKKFGVAGLMSSKKQIKRENIDFNIEPSEQGRDYFSESELCLQPYRLHRLQDTDNPCCYSLRRKHPIQ